MNKLDRKKHSPYSTGRIETSYQDQTAFEMQNSASSTMVATRVTLIKPNRLEC